MSASAAWQSPSARGRHGWVLGIYGPTHTGRQAPVTYGAMIPNESEAIRAIEGRIPSDSGGRVKIIRQLSSLEIDSLRLGPGEVRLWPGTGDP